VTRGRLLEVGGIALLTAAGLALRLVGLDGGLWVDEISSLLESYRPPLYDVLTVFPGDTQHPFYALLANLALKTLGEANWVIRLPAALAGAATVPLLYLFGKRVTSRREAFLAAALLAVSYHHVWFSQNARGYSMLLFLTVLATLFLIEGLRRPRASCFLAYAVVAALGVFTHLTMVFTVAAHALVVAASIIARRRRGERTTGRGRRLALLGVAGVAAAALALYAPVARPVARFFLDPDTLPDDLSTLGWTLEETREGLGHAFGGVAGLLAACVMTAIGLASYLRRDRLVGSVFILPGFVTLVGAFALRDWTPPRFFFALAGFAVLALVRGVMAIAGALVRPLPGAWPRPALGETMGTAVLTLAVAATAVPTLRAVGLPKQDFVAAAHWIEENVPAEDLVVTVGSVRPPFAKWLGEPWLELRHRPGALAAIRAGGRRVWLVYTFRGRTPHEVEEVMSRECGSARRFAGTLQGGDIVVCPLDPTPR
jgi:4-amino-4-deoxy-L-arabinose transferase-like glycosyltransferase